MMESAFNSFKIVQLIPQSKGGTLRTTQPIDNEKIADLLSTYYNKLFNLRNLKFLSEEKKTLYYIVCLFAKIRQKKSKIFKNGFIKWLKY